MTNKITRLNLAPPSSRILEGDVSINRLVSFLDSAVIEYDTDDDGKIYASDGLDFPAWISIDADRKYIVFHTFASI